MKIMIHEGREHPQGEFRAHFSPSTGGGAGGCRAGQDHDRPHHLRGGLHEQQHHARDEA